MKKRHLLLPLLLLTCMNATVLTGCGGSKSELENYYVINTNGLTTEMLFGTTTVLDPKFTNLGEACTPNYSVVIKLDDVDVTSKVYNAETKVFNPDVLGEYKVTFTVLTDNGETYKTKNGSSFSANITINVVELSFAPLDSEGPDITISNNGVITFGETYKNGNDGNKVDSGQYKVTGVSFTGNYSITYKIEGAEWDSTYNDCALYFGWNKDWPSNYDDCFKVGAGSALMSAWIWGKNGDLSNLSINRNQGWTKGGWWDAPGTLNEAGNIRGDHTITFERFVNTEENTAIYGILFDGQPSTYLNVGEDYSNLLTNVWVESNNTACSISVLDYHSISDEEAPVVTLNYGGDYTIGDTVNLKSGVKITDNSNFASVLTPSFRVYDSNGEECEVVNNAFTAEKVGTYKVVATVYDLAFNVTEAEGTIVINEIDSSKTIVDVSQTSSVCMSNNGIVLYANATNNGKEVPIDTIVVRYDDEDYSEECLFHYVSPNDPNCSYYYFKPIWDGDYQIVFTSLDGVSKTKDVNVDIANTEVYGFTFYDLGSMQYKDKFAVGQDMVIYFNNGTKDKQCAKLGKAPGKIYNWTIEYDITDMSFVKQGKVFITKNTLNGDGDSIGWEDLTIGGQCTAEGDPDLWGYECDVQGTGWTSYQWRSTWQEPVTTEFMPDPDDPTKGCGRQGTEYAQYAIGTHHYKMTCEMDDLNKVTYKYYIDNELEVVHHTADAHDGANGLDFYQLSTIYFNGVISNLKVY